jgi:hypothetical protein
MNLVLQTGGYVVGLLLQILTLNSMRRGAYRRYPVLFLYIVADFITTLLEIIPGLDYRSGTPAARRRWARIYWIDEWIIQVLIFLLVISLVYQASAAQHSRRTLLLGLTCATLAFAGISFLVHYSPDMTVGRYMTPWTRDMYFCAAILDLGLWAMLLQSKEKDRRLLMVSGALGIQFTVGAISQALRELSHETVNGTAIVVMLANLTCIYIWWQAFRTPARPSKSRLA